MSIEEIITTINSIGVTGLLGVISYYLYTKNKESENEEKTRYEKLEIRLNELETSVQQKDQIISDLRVQVAELATQLASHNYLEEVNHKLEQLLSNKIDNKKK